MNPHAEPSPPAEPRLETLREFPWWHGAVIYQIYPRSFRDSNGDGIGDLPGITASLDYVASLGVDAVWLSPFFTSPMKDFGYDIADYCDVDPIFGTLQDFDRLLEAAHRHGLKVIIDQVYSHTSDQHSWFLQSRADRTNARADWYVWADPKVDGSPPTNWQSVFGGSAWTWNARRGQYYMHNFLSEQPDLNVHNPEVQDALLECARFWFERGVDGFRLDAVNFALHDVLLRDNPPALTRQRPRTRPVDFQQSLYNKSHPDLPRFIERIRKVADEYGGRFTVAEVGGEGSEAEMQRLTCGQRALSYRVWVQLPVREPVDPGTDSNGARRVAGGGRHGLAQLGIFEPRCAASGVALVDAPAPRRIFPARHAAVDLSAGQYFPVSGGRAGIAAGPHRF